MRSAVTYRSFGGCSGRTVVVRKDDATNNAAVEFKDTLPG